MEEATCKKINSKYAMRVSSKLDLVPINEECLIHEINILQSLKHDNIVRLHDVYGDPDSYILVTDLVQENLFDRITTGPTECYNEKSVRNICKVLLMQFHIAMEIKLRIVI